MKKKLICITGPTASGKTALAIKLAQFYNTEIISADSRQFYKEMSIGTAVPDKDELEAAKHHFIQHKSIFEEYSVGDFERDFLNLSKELFAKKEILILVGGSGLYMDAATKGLNKLPGKNMELRESLSKIWESEGIEVLQERLYKLDPVFYSQMDQNNPHRIIRAIEILEQAPGKKMEDLRKESLAVREFDTVFVGLNTHRNILYERINKRVDLMMENNLLEEARKLYPYKHLNALNTVGYKELFAYMDQEISLDFAVSEIKKNTRRFAKRQLTWFRKNPEINWVDINASLEEVLKKIKI